MSVEGKRNSTAGALTRSSSRGPSPSEANARVGRARPQRARPQQARPKRPSVLIAAGGLLTLSLGFVVTVVAPGCITQADEEPIAFACPPAPQWSLVSQVLERKCGTLDCHGDRSRPFRLFGRNGARLSDSMVVGDTDATSVPELAANRESACGLEPEHMAAVIAGEEQATESLTLLRKPLLFEAHKGGRVWTEESPGYLCLSSWIDGATDGAACDEELRIP